MTLQPYRNLQVYYGDLHSHCEAGYGHGSVEDAFQNARTQLDFACVTAHAAWPDMPKEEGELAEVMRYHKHGFQRAVGAWEHLQEVTELENEKGVFVTFLGYEWHSMAYGDYNVYYKGSQGEIIRAGDLDTLRERLRALKAQGQESFLIPHHIGYKRGYRGVNWDAFTPEFSPVAEIFSMHGASESPDAPYPYKITMGPRDWQSTYQYGLQMGHVVGAIGSTDHHAAHPGSYGHGRLGVWAGALTRDALWQAIAERRTYALTGDRIELSFSINGHPMGAILPPSEERQIQVYVVGGGAIDYIEILYNNRPLHRWSAHEGGPGLLQEPVKVFVEIGWGEISPSVDWRVELEVVDGELLEVEPRFRGRDVVSTEAAKEEAYAYSQWGRVGTNGVWFTSRTWSDPTEFEVSTQGMCLKIQGGENTVIEGCINGQRIRYHLRELFEGSQVGYLGGLLTPAYCFHGAVPESEYTVETSLVHRMNNQRKDWYYVRLRQKNGQWAWSSPIWVEAP